MQHDGNRNYQLANGDVILMSGTVNTLKDWNTKYPTVLYDTKFLKRLALDVFGSECLARSSVFGMQARNSILQHETLDSTKLNFIRGNFGILQEILYMIFPLVSFLDLFSQRAGSEGFRKFNGAMNKICNNIRR